MVLDARGKDFKHDVLAAIGGLTVVCARLQQVPAATCSILNTPSNEAARKKFDRLGIDDLIRELKKYVNEDDIDILKILDEAGELWSYRNRVVHDIWYIGDHGSPITLFWKEGETTHRPIHEIEEKTARASHLTMRIADHFWGEIREIPDGYESE